MTPYEIGRNLADTYFKSNMANFEQDDDEACLVFAAKLLQEKAGYDYQETIEHYSDDRSFRGLDPYLSEIQEDVLLGCAGRINEIMKLSEDGYFYHKVKNPDKRGEFDYVLETVSK